MDIIQQTCEILRQVADPDRGTVELSEAAARALRKLGKRREEALEQVAQEVANCTKCDLHKTRRQTVFGGGSIDAHLVFVGEAPGAEEDAQGIPFVGRAGQLLTRIIEKGMKLSRKDVYICNVLKCRPPENRDPTPYEKAQCEPYLIRQLDLIKPKVICALGAHAAQTLLRTSQPTGKLRGRWHFYHGIPLRVTYHPAYLLRSPQEKRKTWEDVLEVLKVYHGEFTPTPSVESIEDLTYGR